MGITAMADSQNQPTTEQRLDELAGPVDEQTRGVKQRVREMMCPCLAGKDCLYPRCGKIGGGMGHYP